MSYEELYAEDRSKAGQVWSTVRKSVLLKLVVIGVLMILTGVVLDTSLLEGVVPNNGMWAAIVPLWGVALIVFGSSVYALIWWSHQ